MGLFDSVYARCHSCGGVVEFQSKAGECYLNNYLSDAVPVGIAVDIEGADSVCRECGREWYIRRKIAAPTEVEMELTSSPPNGERHDHG